MLCFIAEKFWKLMALYLVETFFIGMKLSSQFELDPELSALRFYGLIYDEFLEDSRSCSE